MITPWSHFNYAIIGGFLAKERDPFFPFLGTSWRGQSKVFKYHEIFMMLANFHFKSADFHNDLKACHCLSRLFAEKKQLRSYLFYIMWIIINYTFHKRLSWSGKITVTITSSVSNFVLTGKTNIKRNLFVCVPLHIKF